MRCEIEMQPWLLDKQAITRTASSLSIATVASTNNTTHLLIKKSCACCVCLCAHEHRCKLMGLCVCMLAIPSAYTSLRLHECEILIFSSSTNENMTSG